MALPPVRSKVNPVIKLFSLETIYATRFAASSSVPHLFIGVLSVIYFTCDSGNASTNGVLITAGASALIVMPDSFNIVHRNQIIALAAQHRLPIISPYRFMAEEGGLMSYGVEPVELFRRAAAYVDRILKGAKPAELPVQAPTKFELVINLKAAKTIGLVVPSQLLARSDQLIE